LGKGLSLANPKAAKLEMDLLAAINAQRAKAKLDPFTMDEKLRLQMRQHVEGLVSGTREPQALDAIIKAQALAPNGYQTQYVTGLVAAPLMKALTEDKAMASAMALELGHVGIGAFYVDQGKDSTCQVGVLVVRDLDPMAGKPGLSVADTNRVMDQAALTIKSLCYDSALRQNPNFNGSLVFQLVIGDRGQVTSAKLNAKTGNDTFDACALKIARELIFPAPYKGKPVTLNHPMKFIPPTAGKVVGRLSEGHISRVFRAAEPGMRACYDALVKSKPKLRGELGWYLVVAPSGQIKTLTLEKNEPNDLALTRCVQAEIEKLEFPEPEFGGEVEIRFPIRFEPPPKIAP